MSGEGHLGSNLAQVIAQGSNAKGCTVVYGQHTTVAASDTVATGLSEVFAIIATLASDPVAGAQVATADLSGTAGSVLIKTWKANASGDTALVAASTFSKKVNYIAIGRK